MDRLTNLYNYYKTDKGDDESYYGHHFGEFYEPFFRRYLECCPNVLEIGVQRGISILAHNDYFYHNVELYGVDIDYSLLQFDVKYYDNIHLIHGNSLDPTIINQLSNNKFDIIIDDGSHLHTDMIMNLYNYHKLLSNNGLYILEDLHCDYHESYNKTNEHIVNMLLGRIPTPILTMEQNDELFKCIDKIHIFDYINDATILNSVGATSITMIIEFRK